MVKKQNEIIYQNSKFYAVEPNYAIGGTNNVRDKRPYIL